jgi:very-short-patch-repair endonuclease
MIDDDIHAGPHPGAGWLALGNGVQVRTEKADDLATRLRAWQLVLPFWSAFSSLTAAELRGWWLPPLPPRFPLFVASGRSDRIDRPGLLVCRHDVLQTWELLGGVRVASAPETVLACARDLTLVDVVLIGGAALHAGDVDLEQLRRTARLRRRGAPLLRRAIPLMNGRAESIYEDLLRLLHEVCGVRVQPQYDVVGEAGHTVARGDLLLTGTQTLHELDGGHHRTAEQQQRDLRRDRRILDAGFRRRGYTARDVLHTPMGILRDMDTAVEREHDPARIQAWYSMIRDSLFMPSGRRRLELRLGLCAENAEGTAS